MTRNSPSPAIPAKFATGSISKHLWIMTSTASIGLIGIFVVDLVDMLFLSMLDSDAIIAGVGFAATISFFTVSLSIGISISMGALVSRMIGKNNSAQAKRYIINIAVMAMLLSGIFSIMLAFNLPLLFQLLGAEELVQEIGISYLQILLPALPILSTGMALSSALRAVGDAKLSMYTTLTGGLVNALLDPIFIFSLDMGVEGAALASAISRCVVLAIAFWGISKKHQLLTSFNIRHFVDDLSDIFKVALPAMITNMATPIGNAIVISSLAKFGAAYVAAFSIIGRISPVAFAMVFALSGAIGPIIGQNFGARSYDRVRLALEKALQFNIVYVVAVALLLYFAQNAIISAFQLRGEAAELMHLFCTWIAILFVFPGAQFIANASFNNLGKPIYASYFNIGKSTLGTLPFVIVGGQVAGAPGILIGQALGATLFGTIALIVALRLTKNLGSGQQH